MSKIAEQKALEAYPPTPLNVSLVDYNSFKRTFYAKGYDQAMQDFLEKACEWLKENLYDYYDDVDDERTSDALLIQDFKNYMQKER